MIKFLSAGHDYTMKRFLQHWGKELSPLIDVQNYNALVSAQKHQLCSTYIFADLERINHKSNMNHLIQIWQQLSSTTPRPRLLNHPAHVKKRIDLLQTLYQEGINDFNVHPILPHEMPLPERFPVFIREANDHKGSTSGLINNQNQLEEAILALKQTNHLGQHPIVTEYISLRDKQGLYRKYGAFRIGDQIIAAHLDMARQWMVKRKDMALAESQDFILQEDYDYVMSNPHADELLEIFTLAHIDYGRIDYGIVNGKIQVFEINTNPELINPESYPQYPYLQKRIEYLAPRLKQAFMALEKVPNVSF